MDEAATRHHAHPYSVFHCLYGYCHLGHLKQNLTRFYNKTPKPIGNWIHRYDETGTYARASTKSDRKFAAEQRQWLPDWFESRPPAYLDETQDEFKKVYRLNISKSSVWRIIHEFGLTWKGIERRAVQIKERDIFRFVQELSHIVWSHRNVVLLDEVSFDNRGMLRKR